MTDETLLSAGDRKRIAEIMRVEVRLALQHLFVVLETNRVLDTGLSYHVIGQEQVPRMTIDDDWIYEEL